MEALKRLEQEQMRLDIPTFSSGDTVRVHVKIREGEKERIQVFEGVVIKRHNWTTNATFTVRNKGVATSGGYERYREVKGGRISHIIDPRTGYPTKEILKSVTVIAEDCMTADAFATALYVICAEEGMELINNTEGVECFIVDKDGKSHISKGLIGQIALTKDSR